MRQMMMMPVRRRGEPYVWRADYGVWSWWRLVPERARRWYVGWFNRRYCRKHGHDDMLWHLHEQGPITLQAHPRGLRTVPPPEPHCSACSALLEGCTGAGRYHERVGSQS